VLVQPEDINASHPKSSLEIASEATILSACGLTKKAKKPKALVFKTPVKKITKKQAEELAFITNLQYEQELQEAKEKGLPNPYALKPGEKDEVEVPDTLVQPVIAGVHTPQIIRRTVISLSHQPKLQVSEATLKIPDILKSGNYFCGASMSNIEMVILKHSTAQNISSWTPEPTLAFDMKFDLNTYSLKERLFRANIKFEAKELEILQIWKKLEGRLMHNFHPHFGNPLGDGYWRRVKNLLGTEVAFLDNLNKEHFHLLPPHILEAVEARRSGAKHAENIYSEEKV
jgi:hypothetical protein